jgi:AraC-like DNA-binding protein
MNRVMIIKPTRLLYAGLLGSPSLRSLGALTLYVACEQPFEIRRSSGSSESGFLATVAPNEPHQICSYDSAICKVLFEPECIDILATLGSLPACLQRPDLRYLQIRNSLETLLQDSASLDTMTEECLDQALLGHTLQPRHLDERIRHAVELIRSRPCEHLFAAECARITGLSFSRFIHLFRQQVGMPFRTFCAWKRARTILSFVNRPCNLTELALESGYPDSSHFSHSIRRIYGLRPRDLFAGSRRLTILTDAA